MLTLLALVSARFELFGNVTLSVSLTIARTLIMMDVLLVVIVILR